jgi:hypothetical protein
MHKIKTLYINKFDIYEILTQTKNQHVFFMFLAFSF